MNILPHIGSPTMNNKRLLIRLGSVFFYVQGVLHSPCTRHSVALRSQDKLCI